jgi:hypothetical protein
MDISNPNLNILLMTPGRTGSHMIIHFFKDMTKIARTYREHYENYSILEDRMIQHSHNPKDIFLANDNTYFILNIRNMMETVISKKIAQHIKTFVHYSENINISPIDFTIEEYLQMYVNLKNYYIDISRLIPDNTKIIDYIEFKDNIYNLINIFNIPRKKLLGYNRQLLAIKTPGSHKDWILNYDEIMKLSESLEQDPLVIMGKGSNAPPSSISV